MHARSFVPALILIFAGIASAQNVAPVADAATPAAAAANPAPVAAPAAADTSTEPATVAAAAPAASAAAKPAAPQQRCHKELPTGSSLPKTVCEVDDPDMDHARERALDDLKHAVHSGTRAAGR